MRKGYLGLGPLGFCYQLSPEEFRMRWELVAAPHLARKQLLQKASALQDYEQLGLGGGVGACHSMVWRARWPLDRWDKSKCLAQGRVRAWAAEAAGRPVGLAEGDR